MRTTSVTVMVIFLSKVSFRKYTAMFKVLSQQLGSTLTTAFERHVATEGFTDMDQHRCQAARRYLTYYCTLLFLSHKPRF